MTSDYHKALMALNHAAYVAARAAKAAGVPDEQHKSLRRMAFQTDAMVDANAPGVEVSG